MFSEDGNFSKMRIALIGEGTIGGLFEDIPFRPPQGGHVTHVWEDLVSQRIFHVPCGAQKLCPERAVWVTDDRAYIMFTGTMCRFHGFTLMLM